METLNKKLEDKNFEIDTFYHNNKLYKKVLQFNTRTIQNILVRVIDGEYDSCFLEEDNIKFNLHSEITLDQIETEEQFWQLYNLLEIK